MKQTETDTIPYIGGFTTGGLPIPPAMPDSLPGDSLHREPVYGIVIKNPIVKEPIPVQDSTEGGMSWVWAGLVILFCVVALKFKNNARYLRAVVSDLTDVRERHNAFDDTVKETSFLILLNVMWVVCVGVLLWQTVMLTTPKGIENSFSIPDQPATGIAVCVGMAALYALMMFVAYWMVGCVFADRVKAKMWLKGAGASQGLEVMLLLPLAALTLSYSPWTLILLEIAAGVFILGKIVFIYKGFRIFFNQFSSWMLFLYYLCSLEIVPLILTYIATLQVCSIVL